MPGMNRGGAAMPGMGGGGMGGGGGDAAQMMGAMYGGPTGWGAGAQTRPTYGLGPQPGSMSERMIRLQKACSAGDGRACVELKIATKQHADAQQQYGQDYAYADQNSFGNNLRPMRAR